MFSRHYTVGWKVQPHCSENQYFDSSIMAIHDMSSKWLHTVAVKAAWFLWGRISANWPSWINRAGGASALSQGRANTPTFSYLYKFLPKYYLSQPRHYYISEDKNVPLTFSSTPHISCSCFFFSPHLVTLPPHLFFFFLRCRSPSPPYPSSLLVSGPISGSWFTALSVDQ